MSPAQHPSGRPPSIYGNQFASSNSTANRFLGSTQRPWMTNAGPLSPSTRSYPRNPVNFQAKHPRTSSRQSTTSSTTTQPPTRIETSDHQSTAHASDSTVARPTQTGPVSPVTPGTGHSENDLQPSAAKVARLDNAVPTASFPTPEPSNPSLASPVAAVTERAVSSSKDVPASLPGAGAQPPVNIKWKGATTATPTPTSLSPVVVANSPPQPQSQPPSQSQSRHSSPPHKSHRIWEHARERLKTFLVQSPRTHTLSETVELPRVRILQDACGAEDMFYLALHQIFCLNSTDPSQLREVADYGIVPNLGFDVIAQLLVDNKRLSKEFLQWSIEYPMPFQILLLSDDYKKALKQVSHCLSTISNHWPVFEREVRARGHPPQVDELVVRLGVESPVFQTIVFTAISRRLFGTREELFKACIALFEEDQRTYNQRSTFSADVRRQAMFNYFGRYRQLCASHGMLAVPDSFRDQTTSAPRATSSSAQAPTSIMNSPKTPLQQNHTQHRASTSIPRQLPSNPHPNTHPGGPRPLPTTLHHVSPNLAPNAGQQQQQQQQVLHQNIALPTGNIQHAQAHQQQLYPSQFHGSFPPPSQYVVASQSTIPASPAPPNPMLPPNIQMQSSFPPVRQSSNGIDASTFPHPQYFSSVIAANMVPTSSSPVQSPYPTTQPPPNSRGQGQHPLHPQGHLQPAPSVHFPMPTQPSGTLFTMYPQMPTQALHPHLAPSLPGQHNPNPEPPDVIQYFSGFSVVPQRLPPNRSSFTWKFTVPREILRLRPKLVRRPNNSGFISLLSDGNMSFRLRCIKYPGSQDVDSIATWSQAESHWPNVVYIHVNNREVYRSPKAKNSPISINSYLIDGSNEIRVNVLHSKQRCAADTSYAVAVEILQVKSPESFRKLVKKLPAQETRQQILARLSSSNANDDDLMIMDDFISINLRDPFTARIFDIPVRGSLCTHKECFDLSTFLQTLTAKPLAEKHKIYVRCPICRKDARPELLVIDEFLGEVRDSLSKENKLETAKAIRVKSDGSWSTVLDTENDSRTAGRKRDRASFESDHVKNEDRPSTSTPRGTSAPEVIELD